MKKLEPLLIFIAAFGILILFIASMKSCNQQDNVQSIVDSRQHSIDSLNILLLQYNGMDLMYKDQIAKYEEDVTKHKAQLAEQKRIIRNLRSIVVAKRGNEQLMEYIFSKYSNIVDTLPIKNPTMNLPVAVVTQMVQDVDQKDLCAQENYHLDSALQSATTIIDYQDSIKIVYETSITSCNEELALCKAIKDSQLLQIESLHTDVAKKEKKISFFKQVAYVLGAGLAGSLATQFLSKPND